MTLEDLKQEIDRLLLEKDQVLLAIDGPCASGKTTLAKTLASLYDCNVFHMDDFFLRPEIRTKERLVEIGGNVEYERFYTEVLLPLQSQKEFSYQKYDCQSRSLQDPVTVIPKQLNIIEGSYSMHLKLSDCYDFSVFLKITPEMQRERIFKRNPLMATRFFEEWIPMENAYFEATKAEQRCSANIINN